MSSFNSLSHEEQQNTIDAICALAVECGLEEYVKPQYFKIAGCELKESDGVSYISKLQICGNCPLDKSDAVAQFNEKLQAFLDEKQLLEDVYSTGVVAMCSQGTDYKPVTGVPVGSTDPVEITYTAGQVWYLLFWNSYGDQDAMKILEGLLEKRKGEWGSNVRVIALAAKDSVESINIVRGENGGTENVEIYLMEEHSKVLLGDDDEPFGIFLDKEGKVAQRGRPILRDNLEKDFDDLLAGTALTGEGVVKDPWDFPEGYSKLDLEAVHAELAAFGPIVKELQENEVIKENASKLIGATCNVMLDTFYCPKSGEQKSKFEARRQLTGHAASVEACKQVLEEKVKGSFGFNDTICGIDI